jgi:hypothetical protein
MAGKREILAGTVEFQSSFTQNVKQTLAMVIGIAQEQKNLDIH